MQPWKVNFLKKKIKCYFNSGVNGVGKTTTIGNAKFQNNGNKIVLGVRIPSELPPLNNWKMVKQIGGIISSSAKSDPASVAYKTLEYAKTNNFDQ